ncbi:hypothetical protein G5V59_05580 [Nocardioides sp. W3-2-3]|nr:hypothetical protein [Nocardioides convexus]
MVNDIAPDLLDATDDVLVTMNTIVTQQASFSALIAGGTNLARTSRAFLAKNQANLVRFINGSAALLDAVYDNRKAGITDAFAINIALGSTLPSAVKEGFVKTEGNLLLTPPDYYTSPPRFRPTGTSPAGFGALGGE